MATLSRGYSFGATEQVTNAKLHGLVDDGAVSSIATADLQDASVNNNKIASCSGAKFISLASTPSGAGVIPAANLTSVAQKGANSDITSITGLTTALTVAQGGTGSTAAANAASGVVVLDASSKLPAVDGSALTAVIPADGTVTRAKLDSALLGVPVFNWTGGTLAKYNVGAITKNVSGTNYAYLGTVSSSFDTVLVTKFLKTSGVNTVTVYAAITGNTSGDHCQVTITGATAIQLSSGGVDHVFAWDNDDIDVSGLTDGTVYDVTVQLKGYEGYTAKMAYLIGFGK